jgi:general secretion pathway protein J
VSRGFTLLELLVAMTLLALLMAALAGGLRFGGRAFEAGELRVDHLERVLVTHGFLRRQLGAAWPLWDEEAGDGGAVLFEGEADSLRFVAFLPEHLGGGEMHLLVLREERGPLRRDLVLDWEPLRAELAPPHTAVLLEDVAEVRFAFRGLRELETAAPPWRERWRDMSALPELVRLSVRFPDGDRRSFPDLVIRPALGHAAGAR